MQLVNASEITEAWREKNILKGLKEKTVNPGFYISQKYRRLRALFLFFFFYFIYYIYDCTSKNWNTVFWNLYVGITHLTAIAKRVGERIIGLI